MSKKQNDIVVIANLISADLHFERIAYIKPTPTKRMRFCICYLASCRLGIVDLYSVTELSVLL